MKEIKLTQGKVALVDDADFEWLNQWKWFAAKCGNTFYAHRNEEVDGRKRTIRMHRLILGVTDPKVFVDHERGDGLNNQRYNLRMATQRQNSQNRKPQAGSASKYKGVSFNARLKKWLAQIRVGSSLIHIGCYKQEEDAALAYNEAAIKHHGEFARLNVV